MKIITIDFNQYIKLNIKENQNFIYKNFIHKNEKLPYYMYGRYIKVKRFGFYLYKYKINEKNCL